MKKIKNKDFLFAIALIMVFALHMVFVFLVPYSDDESYYVTVPFRLLTGDSLVQHEWHLTQFFSLFNFIPVYIWTAIKGSYEGVFIFLRCIYLMMHTTTAVIVYRFFRKYGIWAIMASMMFYVQIPYRFLAINYQSIYVMSLLLMCLSLLKIYEKQSTHFYIFVGACIGCCCVCNPFFCVVYVLYLIGCIVWTKRNEIIRGINSFKISRSSEKEKKLTKKQKKEQEKQIFKKFPDMEAYNCFFTKQAIIWITCGLLIVAVIAVAFFFLTGGTIDSIFDNIENLLGSTEYDIASSSVFKKFIATLGYFNKATIYTPWVVPVLFVVMMLDKKRKYNTHRLAYLSVAIIWSLIFILGVMLNMEIYFCGISLPFAILSTMCYILTKNRNKKLFFCMCVPCLVATFFQYLAADTHLGVIGVVLAIYNVAGVIFAKDLYNEIHCDSEENSEEVISKEKHKWCHRVIIIGFCVQILFYGIFYQYGQFHKDAVKATTGPYSGLYMSETQYNKYSNVINDLDIIKARSAEDDPVLIITYGNWMYLHLERPMSIYTSWFRGAVDLEQMDRYYKENPDKRPEYIYVDTLEPNSATVDAAKVIADQAFGYTEEQLSHGVLLTVEK